MRTTIAKSKRLLLGCLAGALVSPAMAVDSTTPCADVFDNGATSHVRNVKLEFKRDAGLLNSPTPVLGFNVITKDKKSDELTCDTVDCSSGGPLGATLDPGPFQNSPSNSNFEAPRDGLVLEESAYRDVRVRKDTTLEFDPNISEYYLHKLEVEENGVVVLQPGDYWIHDLKLKPGARIVVGGSGTARIFAEHVRFEDDVLVNSPEPGVAGDPSKLFLYAYDDVKLEDDSTFSGFIYGEEKFETEKRVSIFGAVSAGKKVTLETESRISYDASAVGTADFGCLCSCAPADLLDHFRIGAAPVGVTCEAQTVTVTAFRSDGAVYDLFGGTIALSTSTGLGSWTLISGAGTLSPGATNTGLASYTFDANDAGQVTLGLRHATPGLVNIDVSDGQGISELSNNAPPEDPDVDMRDAAFRFYANGVPDAVGTQIAAKGSSLPPGAQNLTLRAVATGSDGSTCESRLPVGVHSIALGYQCISPNRCVDPDALTVNGAQVPGNDLGSLNNLVSVDLSFVVTGTTIEAPVDINYFDAGRIVMHAEKQLPTDTAGPEVTLQGASNAFVVRPFALGVNGIAGPGGANPGGTASGGAGFLAAGAPFSFNLGAYRYSAGDDLDSDGIPDPASDVTDNGITPAFAAPAVLQVSAITPAGGTAGVLNPSTVAASAFSNGVAPVPGVTYAEAGSVTLAASSENYLSDPLADVPGRSPEIGRFYPDSFEVLLDAVTPGCIPGGFSYMGEPALGISYRLLARNAFGATTRNYDAGLGYSTGLIRYHAENGDDGVDRGDRISARTGLWRQGSYVWPEASASYSDPGAIFARGTAPDGPYQDLQMGLSVVGDPDDRKIRNPDMDPNSAGECSLTGSCSAAALTPATAVRFGRVRAVDAYGPETLDLPVPVLAEYFDGVSFVRNVNDSGSACSRLPAAVFDLQSGSALGVPIPLGDGSTTGALGFALGTDFFFSSGDAGLIFSAPGAGNTGRVSVDLDLSGHPWLQFDWDADGSHDDNPPQATAIFGRYRGHDRIIYWSEQR